MEKAVTDIAPAAPVASAPIPTPREERPPMLEAVASRVRELARDPEPQQPAIRQAVEHINEIVVSLQQLLDQMEEVLELTELADRQKSTDEREIESLRRALRQIQRPRNERQDRPERHERFNRPERQDRPERPDSPREEEFRTSEPESDAPPSPDEPPPQQ